MSIASSQRTSVDRLDAARVRFLVSIVVVAVGVVIAVSAVAVHRGPNEVPLMIAVPP
jgi:hypothetical protein